MKSKTILLVVTACVLTLCISKRAESSTPSRHFGNNGRTGYTDATVPSKPILIWTYEEKHPPRHAWKEPNRELQYIDFDYATQVAIGDGMALFGSSADHKVYAVDRSTGDERWHFYTEGPVRFAPVIDKDRAYVVSDDGYLYCLNLNDGSLVWKFRGGPNDDKLIGNDQMISHWPARSGVLIEDGKLYFTSGMWSRDGVFIYCLDARDASVIWKNDTSGFHFATLPHSAGFAGVAPQGYLALHRNRLYVPTGRGAPACFDARTGEFIFYENGHGYKPHQPGGSRVMAWRNWVIFKRRSQHREEDVRYEERTPAKGAALGLYALNFRTGEPEWSLTDRNIALARKNFLILGGAESVIKVDIGDLMEGYQKYWKDGKWLAYDENIRTSGVEYTKSAKGHLIPRPAWMSPLPFKRWEASVGRVFTMVQADDTILAGARGKIYGIDFNTGAVLWEKDIDGDARGISVVDGCFIVSSTVGKLYCFAEGDSDSGRTVRDKVRTPAISRDVVQLADTILSKTGVREGYALMLGTGDGQLIRALVEHSELTVYCLEPDSKRASRVRQMLDDTGLLGVRAAVHIGTFDELPYNPYFGNLVLWGGMLGSDSGSVAPGELYRVLRPYGGIACQLGKEPGTRQWLVSAGVPAEEISDSFAGVEMKRGGIEGAGQWTHPYANIGRTSSSGDTLAKLPLGMLWWGGPGPARIVSRHWRAPVPLFSNGILYVQGQHDVFAVDAYNGREMWNRHLEDVGRFPPSQRGGNIVADETSVFCIQERRCLRLDAHTGETVQEYVYPLDGTHVRKVEELIANYAKRPDDTRIVWEYLGLAGQYVIGTVANEAVTGTGGIPFGDAPQVGKYVFAFNKNTGKLVWDYCVDRTVSPMAIVADEANLYLLDRTDERLYRQTKRRGESVVESSIKALDLETGTLIWEKPGITA